MVSSIDSPMVASGLPILTHIRNTWRILVRSSQNLAAAAPDPKYRPEADGRWPVFVSDREDFHRVENELRREMGGDFNKIRLEVLPRDSLHMDVEGLLYLPRPYVVPGGRFNEMYGWDSFFIEMGLLRDGEFALAKDMADNCLYEIREYGKVLNANRTYYLSRSQAPFLTQMILAVYRHTQDAKWLAEALPAMEDYYGYWTTEPHLTSETGLGRYYDLGEGPAPEVISSELDKRGRTDYELIRRYFRSHHVTDYDASQYYDRANDRLTALFYKGDRSMRESGFDPSNRFGPFSIDIIHYNPVCLNSLLYQMETDMARILDTLDRPQEGAKWNRRAELRAGEMNRLMWDTKRGLYFDYDFVHKRVREYPFLTTFYPLWTGIASREQAARVAANLALFERAGGLQTSTRHSGDQWDAPFGWAPLQWIAVEGLRRYGYQAEADRISKRFLTMVQREYKKHGVIDEKYDVVRAKANLGREIRFGYLTNAVGFGWTNAVYTALFDQLPATEQEALTG